MTPDTHARLTDAAADRLRRINLLWLQLEALGHVAYRTSRYRALITAISVEAEAFTQLLDSKE